MAERSVADLEKDAFLAEADMLATLTSSLGYMQYEVLITNMRAAAMEEMAKTTPDRFPYWQGVVAAYADVLERPRQIVQGAAEIHKEEASDAERLLDVRRSLEMTGSTVDDL
jgi:hypothetical protein